MQGAVTVSDKWPSEGKVENKSLRTEENARVFCGIRQEGEGGK